MFLKSFPYGEKEFFLQSHPMQNLFHPFIQGFEQELAQCEWAYTSWICFDDGEMIEDTLRCKPEEFLDIHFTEWRDSNLI